MLGRGYEKTGLPISTVTGNSNTASTCQKRFKYVQIPPIVNNVSSLNNWKTMARSTILKRHEKNGMTLETNLPLNHWFPFFFFFGGGSPTVDQFCFTSSSEMTRTESTGCQTTPSQSMTASPSQRVVNLQTRAGVRPP